MRALLFVMGGGWSDPEGTTAWKAEVILLPGSCFPSDFYASQGKEWKPSQSGLIYFIQSVDLQCITDCCLG